MDDCFDPLHHMDSEAEEDMKCISDEKEEEIEACQGDQASRALHWSVEHVENWLKQNVPFDAERLQDFVYACRSESVDGLSLLTLQRSHLACEKLTDSEWLILKIARRRLLSHGKHTMCNKISIEDVFCTSPTTPKSFGMRSPSGARDGSEADFVLDSERTWNALNPPWDSAKDDQHFTLEKEVQSLRGEIVGAEEREITLQAKLDHLDQVLRTSRLAGYLKTRTSLMAFPGDASYESSNIDGWLQRFLVLQGSCIYYYLRATDLRPQGTILLSEIVEIGQLLQQFHCEGSKEKFSFHITTCHGFRLECCSSLKYQVKAWLTAIRAIHNYHTVENSCLSPSKNLEKSTTLASWLDATIEQSPEQNESERDVWSGEMS